MAKKKTRGRKAHKPSRAQLKLVERMTLLQLSQEKIAAIIGISLTTLKTHYALHLTLGKARIGDRCVQKLLETMEGKDPKLALTAATWLLSHRYGWSQSSHVELTQRLTGAIVVPADATDLAQYIADQEARNRLLVQPSADNDNEIDR